MRWLKTMGSGVRRSLLVLGLSLAAVLSAQASFNVYNFDNPQQEQRFDRLIDDLRCPKCQNNNLADSNAPLATDIKNYIYRAILKGQSDEEITDFLISRYGRFITYDPQQPLLWIVPLMAVLIGGGFVIARLQQQKQRMQKVGRGASEAAQAAPATASENTSSAAQAAADAASAAASEPTAPTVTDTKTPETMADFIRAYEAKQAASRLPKRRAPQQGDRT